MALDLAMQQPGREIYRIPRFVNWSQIERANPQKASIVLPDALGTLSFEREQLDSELGRVRRLLANENLVIITSPDDVFSDATKETRLLEWISKTTSAKPFHLGAELYTYQKKLAIFRRTVRHACKDGKISDEQQEWALKLAQPFKRGADEEPAGNEARNRDLFQPLMKKHWLPIDIERFIFVSLPNARQETDIYDLLRRDAHLDSRAHSWFMELDDSTRCFVFTLALLAGHGADELWEKHKQIVVALRRFDPNLSILPLGVLRQRAAPYVTQDGSIDFINPRVHRAVVSEIAKNYREYFIELIPSFKKWSIPDYTTKEDRDERIAETEDTRNAIARLAGEVGRYGLEDITGILEAWATHSLGRIGKTAGIALKQTILDPASTQQVLRLLDTWLADTSSENKSRLWASASALWRIVSIKSSFNLSDFALKHLARLARGSDHYVAGSAAYALRMMARDVPIAKMASTLTKLAKRNDTHTRKQVALAIDEAAGWNDYNLLAVWDSLGSKNVHWTAVYTLLVGQNISCDERYPRLARLMKMDPTSFVDALHEALGSRGSSDVARSVLETMLVRESAVSTRKQVALVVDDLADRDEKIAQDLLEAWVSLEQTMVQWTAIYTLLVGWNVSQLQRYSQLAQLATTNAKAFVDALYEALKDEQHSETAWSVWQTLLTWESEGFVSAQVALAVDEAARWDQESAHNLLEMWASSEYTSVHWAAIYALLVGQNIARDERYPRLVQLMTANTTAFTVALFEALMDKTNSDMAWSVLETLLQENGVSTRRQVAFALDETAGQGERVAYDLLDVWGTSQRTIIHWMAVYTLFVGQNIPQIESHPRLVQLMTTNSVAFVDALHGALKDEDRNGTAWSVLETLLASKSDVRRQIARVLDEVASREIFSPYELLDIWASSRNNDIHWTAIYTLLVGQNISLTERYPRLIRLMNAHASTFIEALRWALRDQGNSGTVLSVLETLAAPPPNEHRKQLISALADGLQERSTTMQDLRRILLAISNPAITSLPSEVVIEILRRVAKRSAPVSTLGGLSPGEVLGAIAQIIKRHV